MPQTYNKDIARTVGGAFGKQSRFMNVNDSGAETKKRLLAKLKIEKRFRKHNLAVIERNTNIATAQLDRIAREMKASLLKTLAYKEVIAKKTFSKITDRKERLNGRYTQYAMRYEIAEQIKKLEPVFVREEKARGQIDKQRAVLDKIIKRNLRTILSPRDRERKRLLKELGLERRSTFASSLGSPEPQAITSRQNTKGIIVTKDQVQNKGQSKPTTLKLPSIFDTNTPSAGKKKSFTPGVVAESAVKIERAKLTLPPIKVNTAR